MIELSGIVATDEINRYNHKIEFKAFYNNYVKQWNEYIPSFANHDHTKPIGCTRLEGFCIKPGTVYMMNSFIIGESDEEEKKINNYCLPSFYHKQIEEHNDLFKLLKEKLGKHLTDKHKIIYNGGAYIYDKDIVKRMFPKLYSETNDGLIELNKLKPIAPGIYKIDDFIICAHQYFRRGLSRLNTLNEPFLEKLQSLNSSKSKIQIALDFDFVGLANSYVRTFEYQYWWGPYFSDDLTKMPCGVSIHKNEHYNSLLSPFKQTEFRWYEQDDKHTFECEELLEMPNVKEGDEELYGCRFVHSMVDEKTNMPIHLDGAIRAYTLEKMCERLETTLDKTARDTIYTKIWRIDNLLSVKTWKELITHYYRDNMLIGEYFGGKDSILKTPSSEDKEVKKKEKNLRTYIPFKFPQEEFLSFGISFQEKQLPKKHSDIQIIPLQSIIINNDEHPTVDYMSIPLLKLLKKERISLDIRHVAYIACDDNVHNFPHFLCKNVKFAQKVLEKFKHFISSWNNEFNEMISFTIEYPDTNKNICISFMGKKSSFIHYFNSKNFEPLPSKQENLYEWSNNLYNFITTSYKKDSDIDPIEIFRNGDLIYYRRMIDNKRIGTYRTDSKGVFVEILLTKEEMEIVKSENIGFASVNWYKEIKCNKCDSNYLDCNCVLYDDKDVSYTITNLKILGCVWYPLDTKRE